MRFLRLSIGKIEDPRRETGGGFSFSTLRSANNRGEHVCAVKITRALQSAQPSGRAQV